MALSSWSEASVAGADPRAAEIGRRGDQHASAGRETLYDQPVVADRRVPDHGVEPGHSGIHKTIVEFESQLDPGMRGQEGPECGIEMQDAEADRGGYPQRTREPAMPLRHFARGLLDQVIPKLVEFPSR